MMLRVLLWVSFCIGTLDLCGADAGEKRELDQQVRQIFLDVFFTLPSVDEQVRPLTCEMVADRVYDRLPSDMDESLKNDYKKLILQTLRYGLRVGDRDFTRPYHVLTILKHLKSTVLFNPIRKSPDYEKYARAIKERIEYVGQLYGASDPNKRGPGLSDKQLYKIFFDVFFALPDSAEGVKPLTIPMVADRIYSRFGEIQATEEMKKRYRDAIEKTLRYGLRLGSGGRDFTEPQHVLTILKHLEHAALFDADYVSSNYNKYKKRIEQRMQEIEKKYRSEAPKKQGPYAAAPQPGAYRAAPQQVPSLFATKEMEHFLEHRLTNPINVQIYRDNYKGTILDFWGSSDVLHRLESSIPKQRDLVISQVTQASQESLKAIATYEALIDMWQAIRREFYPQDLLVKNMIEQICKTLEPRFAAPQPGAYRAAPQQQPAASGAMPQQVPLPACFIGVDSWFREKDLKHRSEHRLMLPINVQNYSQAYLSTIQNFKFDLNNRDVELKRLSDRITFVGSLLTGEMTTLSSTKSLNIIGTYEALIDMRNLVEMRLDQDPLMQNMIEQICRTLEPQVAAPQPAAYGTVPQQAAYGATPQQVPLSARYLMVDQQFREKDVKRRLDHGLLNSPAYAQYYSDAYMNTIQNFKFNLNNFGSELDRLGKMIQQQRYSVLKQVGQAPEILLNSIATYEALLDMWHQVKGGMYPPDPLVQNTITQQINRILAQVAAPQPAAYGAVPQQVPPSVSTLDQRAVTKMISQYIAEILLFKDQPADRQEFLKGFSLQSLWKSLSEKFLMLPSEQRPIAWETVAAIFNYDPNDTTPQNQALFIAKMDLTMPALRLKYLTNIKRLYGAMLAREIQDRINGEIDDAAKQVPAPAQPRTPEEVTLFVSNFLLLVLSKDQKPEQYEYLKSISLQDIWGSFLVRRIVPGEQEAAMNTMAAIFEYDPNDTTPENKNRFIAKMDLTMPALRLKYLTNIKTLYGAMLTREIQDRINGEIDDAAKQVPAPAQPRTPKEVTLFVSKILLLVLSKDQKPEQYEYLKSISLKEIWGSFLMPQIVLGEQEAARNTMAAIFEYDPNDTTPENKNRFIAKMDLTIPTQRLKYLRNIKRLYGAILPPNDQMRIESEIKDAVQQTKEADSAKAQEQREIQLFAEAVREQAKEEMRQSEIARGTKREAEAAQADEGQAPKRTKESMEPDDDEEEPELVIDEEA